MEGREPAQSRLRSHSHANSLRRSPIQDVDLLAPYANGSRRVIRGPIQKGVCCPQALPVVAGASERWQVVSAPKDGSCGLP
jgi:hypothetical protein